MEASGGVWSNLHGAYREQKSFPEDPGQGGDGKAGMGKGMGNRFEMHFGNKMGRAC